MFPRSVAPYRTVSEFSPLPPARSPASLGRPLVPLEGAIQSRERNWILGRLLEGVSPLLSLFPVPSLGSSLLPSCFNSRS